MVLLILVLHTIDSIYIFVLKMREAHLCPAPSGQDKKFQFALKIGWRALAEGEPTQTFPNWRRRRDSNSRMSEDIHAFQACAMDR